MPFQIINEDITKVSCDAIVNPTDNRYSAGGGTDRAVHEASGSEMDKACKELPPLSFGEVAYTPGYNLPCKYVIHTMGPIWMNGINNESVLLRSCYVNSLLKASSLGAKSVAFPLISSGTFGFPKDKVLRIAIDAISDYLYSYDEDMQIYICVKDKASFDLSREIALKKYLDDGPVLYGSQYADTFNCYSKREEERPLPCCSEFKSDLISPVLETSAPSVSLDDWIKKQDDTFPVMLFKLIDKKGMTDVECYKKANVTKGTFYKIRNMDGYKPSKATVLAFAIALELDLDETDNLLRTVGFSLSHSSKSDRIIEFYIMNGIYDIFEINAALFKYDQVPLGC